MSTVALAIAIKGEWNPDALIEGLRNAGMDTSTEVHVACDTEYSPETAPSEIKVHSRTNASLFDLWGLAASQCEADWIAILHANAIPTRGWLPAIEAAIARDRWRDGYWGPVEPGFPSSDTRMVGYLTEYVQFHRPIDTALSEIPGSNLVLPRQAFAEGGEFSKTRMRGEGLSPKRVDDAVVLYARPIKFGDYCARRYRHGRSYAAKRVPRMSRVLSIPMTAVLPAVRTGRILRHAWRYERFRAASLRWLPRILLAETCWSAGELVGYVTGSPGDTSALD